MKPSATPGRVQFDRTGPDPPGPFNLDIGTTENLVVNANGGNDTIKGSKGLAELIDSTFNGGDGNDRIKGTDGKDVLSGGKANDLIRARDQASDDVKCQRRLTWPSSTGATASVDARSCWAGCCGSRPWRSRST